jgi:hypothetical protein
VKVVVLVTQSTTKLVLHILDFSMILYDFPRFNTRGQSLTFGFTNKSLDFTVRPLGGFSSSAIRSLGAANSGDHQNPAKGGPGLAGKVAGDDERLTYGRFEGLEAAGGAPARELDGGRPWRPLGASLRRAGSPAWTTHGRESSRRS